MFLSKIKNFITTNAGFLLLLSITVFLLYGKSINFDFTYHDDDILIINNTKFLSEAKNIPHLFFTSCYLSNNSFYYRPVLNLSFAAETIFFGSSPKIYHFTNIIFFILALYSSYLLLVKLKFDKNILKFIFLLMAAHPIFVSCIAWIPGRNDTLLTAFICLAFINFLSFIEQNKTKYLLLHCLFFTLALFTKETMFMLVPIYIFLICCFNYKISKQQILKNLMILIPVIIIYFIFRNSAVAPIDSKEYFLNYKKYAFNTISGTMTYIDKFIMPDYIPLMLHNIKIGIGIVIMNAAVLFLLVFMYVKKITGKKNILFAAAWFILLLLPTFLQKEYIFLPHRLILASLGVAVIITSLVHYVITRYPVSKKYLIALYLMFFSMFLYLSYIQTDKYKKADVYWSTAYIDAPDYHLVLNGLAKVYLSAGDYEQYKNFIYEAYRLSYGDRYIFDITSILIHEGNTDEAEKICLNILSDSRNKPFLKFGSMSTLGEIYLKKNNIKKAYFYTKEAFKINPYDSDVSEKLEQIKTMLKNRQNAV